MTIDLSSSDATVVLNNVNSDVGTWGMLTVNAKGLVVAARNLTATDVSDALGYEPIANTDFPIAPLPNGSTALPNGLILQWGTVAFTGVPSTTFKIDAET